MAAHDPSQIAKISGRLCKDPSDLSADFPHGTGTALGTLMRQEWLPNKKAFPVYEEALGTTVEDFYTGEEPTFMCVTRDMDNDFLSSVFLDTFTGATQGRTGARGRVQTDGFRAGTSLDSLAVKLYFSPDDKTQRGLYMYRAIPRIAESAKINLQLGNEGQLLCIWRCVPDDAGDVYEYQMPTDITL